MVARNTTQTVHPPTKENENQFPMLIECIVGSCNLFLNRSG